MNVSSKHYFYHLYNFCGYSKLHTDLNVMSRYVSGVLVTLCGLAFFWNSYKEQYKSKPEVRLNCQDCLKIAEYVRWHVSAAQESRDQVDDEEEELLKGPGRRISFLREDTLTDALDAACDAFSNLQKHATCQTTLTPYRPALEDAIFQSVDSFDTSLCTEILHTCDPHEMNSAGEL